MRPDQYPAFSDTLTSALSFYRADVTPFMLDVWWQACQGFDIEQVAKALTAHAMDPDHGHFAPKPADIVRQLGGTATDRAMLAWGKLLNAMQSVGAYTDVVFDDPAIHAVVEDLGGWVKVCRGETKDLGYLQHRFCEAHRAYCGRREFDFPRLLRGDRAPDEAFARRGLPPPKPAVVGDKSKAMQVYATGSQNGKTRIEFNVGRLALQVLEHGGEQ